MILQILVDGNDFMLPVIALSFFLAHQFSITEITDLGPAPSIQLLDEPGRAENGDLQR